MFRCCLLPVIFFSFIVATPAQTWTTGPDMLESRLFHTATLLKDGRVLVVGGYTASPSVALTAELYDPLTNEWEPTEPTDQGRVGHTATLLQDGRVLVVGGVYGENTSEIFDPGDGTWTESGQLTTGRTAGHTATRMADGSVIVVGGQSKIAAESVSTSAAERWDPDTGLWTPLAPLQENRESHAAVLLPDGRLLVCGGYDRQLTGERSSLATTEIFDPQQNTWSAGDPLAEDRAQHALIRLENGDVLAIGGSEVVNINNFVARGTSEYYDATSGSWKALTNLGQFLPGQTSAALLLSGDVLAVGGFFTQNPLVVLYNTSSSAWLPAPSPSSKRSDTLLTRLKNGRLLLTGGRTSGFNNGTQTVEFFDPPDLVFYPQLALGGGFTCILQVANLTDGPWTGKGLLNGGAWPADQMWQLDGGPPSGDSEFDISLEAFETAEFRLTAEEGPLVGWLTLQGKDGSTTSEIAPAFFYNYVQDSVLIDSIGVGPAPASSAATFPVFKGANVNTGLAVRGTSAALQMTLYGEDGNMVEQLQQEFDGAAFIDQIFHQVPDDFLGLARIESSADFFLLVIRQELVGSGFQLTTIPATPAP